MVISSAIPCGATVQFRVEIDNQKQAEIVYFGLFQFRLQPIGVSNVIRQWKSPFIPSTTAYSLSCCEQQERGPASLKRKLPLG